MRIQRITRNLLGSVLVGLPNRTVEMANQLGKRQRFTVLEPTTLCVPSYKKVL